MKTILIFILSFSLLTLISCENLKNDDSDKTKQDTVKTVSDKFEFERYYFAKKMPSGIEEIQSAVYKRGEDIILVMLNVGKFKRDAFGKNKMELKMEIKDKIGIIVEQQDNILNKRGYKKLINNVAKSPFARYKTAKTDNPGTYLFTLTAVDLIANDSITISAEYFLE